MAKCTRINAAFLLLCWLICFSGFGFVQRVSALGINYGQLGDNLLQPQQVVSLLRFNNITKARIFDTNPQILTAFANSDIQLIVTVENTMLSQLSNPQAAIQWVTTRIKPYLPATKITDIMIGNELDAADLLASLVPAMSSVQKALSQLGLDSHIKVSSPFSYGVMGESYPPSAASFKSDVSDIMSQVLQFLSSTKSPFWINAYPYFAYKGNSKEIPLDYVLFSNDGSSAGVTDPSSNLHYDNLLYAQVDAVIYATKALGFDDIEVKVGETGWPSKGDDDELGASLENAAIYNGNLLKRQLANEGTPLQPTLDVYVFALFNENKKHGPTSERNFGLFQPDGTVVYNVGLTGYSSAKNPAPNSTDAPTPTPSEPPSSDTSLTDPPTATQTPSEPPSSDTDSIEPSSPPTPTLSEPPTSDANSTNALSPPTPSLSEPPTSSLPEIPMTYSSGVKTATTMGRWTKWIIIFSVLIIIFLGAIVWYCCSRSN
ncbi:PREDICTED: glucan endo-1,3-beta-glucosidase 11-like [Fragaria vesca subsp. vesca]